MSLVDEIVNIEEIECDSLRYDIEVEDNHNFYANGILVHNCQNLTKEFETYKTLTFEITEKLEGSSMSVYYKDGVFGVCSRNMELKEVKGNTFWDVANKYNLSQTMPIIGHNIMIQGELVGPGIQGNIYGLKEHEFYVYDIFDIDSYKYVDLVTRADIVQALGLKHVPVLSIETIKCDIPGIIEMADGKSQLANCLREGIVFKCISDADISFKAISNKYLLNEN